MRICLKLKISYIPLPLLLFTEMIKIKEKIYKWLFAISAFTSLIFLAGIAFVLFLEGLTIFKTVGFSDFIFGKNWYPTHEPPEFGILPLILGSLLVTFGALVVCVVLGIGSALYLYELAGQTQKAILKPVIELLASIPSIVFGFFGLVVVAPFLQKLLNIPVGLCAFTASLILGIMAVPTVCSITEDALNYVPKSFKEASFALGANRFQTLTKVVIPAAGSGILTAIMLGISRIIGETMAVLMVSGGAAVIPVSFFQPVRPMTSAIAAELGEAVFGSQHFHALFAIGLVLFLIALFLNIFAEIMIHKYRSKLRLNR